MKRIVMGVLAALLVLSAGAPAASAAGHGHRQSSVQSCITDNTRIKNCANACNYVDADGDGICDNCDNHCSGCGNMCDKNSDGICDNCGTHTHFTDEDCDGICDNCGTRAHSADEDCDDIRGETCQSTVGNRNCGNTGKRSGHHGAGH